MLYIMSRYGPEDSKKVSCVRLGWQKYHQYIQFPPKPHFDLPDHPDGVTKYLFRYGYLATDYIFKMPPKLVLYTYIWLSY